MTTLLDPLAVYEQGLADLASLVGVERLVFMLQDFDNLMLAEGWDHFFLYEHHFIWYAEMKNWLQQIGDSDSLGILSEYESYVRSRGYELSPGDVEEFFGPEVEGYYQCCADWCDRYYQL